MRAFGRRAAIGATSMALVLAAAGTSLAAVRATRYEGGVVPSGMALPAPAATGARAGDGTVLPPTADLPRLPDVPPPSPGSGDPPAEAAPAAPAPTTAPSSGPSQLGGTGAAAGSTASTPPAGGSGPQPARSATVSTLGPASGPTPTTSPGRSSGSCPTDEAIGALPVPNGRLRAVNYALPWPGLGPVVLVPQAGAARSVGAQVRIVAAQPAVIASDGSSLTLLAPLTTEYTLIEGEERARGSIRFTPVGVTEHIERQACRDRSFVLHDLKRASLNGQPLRIVGLVAPPGTVTIGAAGGAAHFRSAAPGTHRVTLLTANDAGTAGSVVVITVTVP